MSRILPLIRGLFGAAAGGIVGYYAFAWVLSQGFYAMILPGAAVGFGFGVSSRERSAAFGFTSAILALGLGVFMEWRFFPFVKDDSFSYFISHIHKVKSISLVMIALGCFFAFRLGTGKVPKHREDNSINSPSATA